MAELALIGTLVSAAGTVASGVAANNAAKSEAFQLEARGKEEFAAGQRDALQKRREAMLVNSRTQALAAASGGGADSPTIVRLMAGTAGEGEYNAQSVMYGAKSRQLGNNAQAKAARASGRASLLGSVIGAAGTAFGGMGKYGAGGGFG